MNTPAKSTSKGSGNEALCEVEVINRQRRVAIDRERLASIARRVLLQIGRDEARATIVFIRDPEIRKLNRDFRGIDKPTDVLAFAYGEAEAEPDQDPGHIGDVIISADTAIRYAEEQDITLGAEIEWLVIHGMLHLAGYDHETDNGEMRRLERRLRSLLL